MRTNNGGQEREIVPARRFVGLFPLVARLGACKLRGNALAILSQFGQELPSFCRIGEAGTFRGCENL